MSVFVEGLEVRTLLSIPGPNAPPPGQPAIPPLDDAPMATLDEPYIGIPGQPISGIYSSLLINDVDDGPSYLA